PINGTDPIHASKPPFPHHGCAITNSGRASRESTTFTAIAICSAPVRQLRNSSPNNFKEGTFPRVRTILKGHWLHPIAPSGRQRNGVRLRPVIFCEIGRA